MYTCAVIWFNEASKELVTPCGQNEFMCYPFSVKRLVQRSYALHWVKTIDKLLRRILHAYRLYFWNQMLSSDTLWALVPTTSKKLLWLSRSQMTSLLANPMVTSQFSSSLTSQIMLSTMFWNPWFNKPHCFPSTFKDLELSKCSNFSLYPHLCGTPHSHP
jgi:hypothetical protein